MFDKQQARRRLADATESLQQAFEELDKIRRDDTGNVADVRSKRRAVKGRLEDVSEAIAATEELVTAASDDDGESPHPTPVPPVELPDQDPIEPLPVLPPPEEPEPLGDLFSIEDQHAVSLLMQDSAVHLATKRTRDYWEIRHRNTTDGRPSMAIRHATIAQAFEAYRADAVRPATFQEPSPRALTAEEQKALSDFREISSDPPRSVRWERDKTEVDYIDRDGQHGGGSLDNIEFEPGELVGPIEHLKSVLD